MDEQQLELWGNLLIQTARNQKAAKSFMQWVARGFPPPENGRLPDSLLPFANLMKSLTPPSEPTGTVLASSPFREGAFFQKMFEEWLTFMGLTLKKDYLALAEQHEKLKTRCAEQEQTIRHLRGLLAAQSMAQADMAAPLREIIRSQSQAFEKMMEGFFHTPTITQDMTQKREKDDDVSDHANGNLSTGG